MPGAGSLVATNSLYSSLPKDGTTLGVIGGGIVLEPLLGNPQATYDARRFNWIGGRTPRQFPLPGLAHGPGETLQDVMQARNRGRRDRSGFADADLSEGAQRAVGDKVQDRVRLSRRQRDHARAGARRGRRLLRLGARQHQDPRAGLDPRRQDQAARAVHAGEVRRASERAAGDRSREHRERHAARSSSSPPIPFWPGRWWRRRTCRRSAWPSFARPSMR